MKVRCLFRKLGIKIDESVSKSDDLCVCVCVTADGAGVFTERNDQ